jgi:hypothetical protein
MPETDATLMTRQHPIRELLEAAAAGADIAPADLDHAASCAREGHREHVRETLADTVRQIHALKSHGQNGPARSLARQATHDLADRVGPNPPQGIFGTPDRDLTPGALAQRISRH